MPNNVTTKIKFYGIQSNIDKVLLLIEGNGGERIDFDKLIPMPDHIYRGNLGEEERQLHGANNWYDWRIENWGTKWNAYDTSLNKDVNTIVFDTAWSCPFPVLEELAKFCAHCNVKFIGLWADEDMGHNAGAFSSDYDENGYKFNYRKVKDRSNAAYTIYTEVKGHCNCLAKDKNGNWVRHDCFNCPNPC